MIPGIILFVLAAAWTLSYLWLNQEVVSQVGTPDGLWPDVVWEQSLTGEYAADPYIKEGAKGVLDWVSNNNNQYWGDYLTDQMTLQEVLDLLQSNWEESYEGLPT